MSSPPFQGLVNDKTRSWPHRFIELGEEIVSHRKAIP